MTTMNDVSGLHKAVVDKKIKFVKTLVKNGANINAGEAENGNTPLHLAATDGNKDIMKILIAAGADVRLKNNEGLSVLECALYHENLNVVKTLIEAGEQINTQDKYGRTALHWAAKSNNTSLIQYLLSRRADVGMKNKKGETALQYACHKVLKTNSFDLEIVTILIKAGSNVNEKDEVGRTPLHWAAMNDNVSLAEKLISCGADLDLKNNAGETVLQSAFNKNSIETAKILINAGGDVRSKDQHGQTALHYAIKDKNIPVIENILSRDADVNSRDNLGQTALHLSVKMNEKSLVEYLISKKASVNVKNNADETALQQAFDQNNYDLAKILISAKGEIGNRSKCGRIDLHLAVEQNNFAKVSKILSGGANFNVKDKNKLTLLHLALIYNDNQSHLAVLKLLLKNKLDVDAQDKLGNTALLLAAKYCCIEMVKNFLSVKANPNLRNHQGESPLSYALERKLLDMAIILINTGAKVDTSNSRCQTALHLAVTEKNIKILKDLLSHDANIWALDNKGLKPIDYLNKNNANFLEIQNLLLNVNTKTIKKIKEHSLTDLQHALDQHDIVMAKICIENGGDLSCRSIELGRSALHLAAQCNDVLLFEHLIFLGMDLNVRDNELRTPLHIAAMFNNNNSHLHVIETLLINKADVNAQDIKNNTSLHVSAKKSCSESIKLLLNYKADVGLKNFDSFTAIQYTLDNANFNFYIIKILIDAGANANTRTTLTGETILHLVLNVSDLNIRRQMIKELLACGVDVNVKNNENKTVLNYIVDQHDLETAIILIDAGGDVNSLDSKGQTLLHLAVQENDVKMIKKILSLGADTNLQTLECKYTPLRIAADIYLKGKKDLTIINLLLEHKADLNIKDIEEKTPFYMLFLGTQDPSIIKILVEAGGDVNSMLHLAVYKNNVDMIKYLLRKGADVNLRDDNNRTPLHYSLHLQNDRSLNVVKVLLENGADINAQDNEGMTLLHYSALQCNKFELTKLLLNYKVNVHIKCNKGFTALRYALDSWNLETITILVDARIDVNSRGDIGQTALFVALMKNNSPLMKHFLSLGADIHLKFEVSSCISRFLEIVKSDVKNDHSISKKKYKSLVYCAKNLKLHLNGICTVLDVALNNYNFDAIKVLIDAGADVNTKSNMHGETVLHFAIIKNDIPLIRQLLSRGADMNVKNNDNKTALQFAIVSGKPEIIQIFIDYGADINTEVNEGQTVLQSAVKNNNVDFVKYLLSRGAEINPKVCVLTPLQASMFYTSGQSHLNMTKILLENKADVNKLDKCRNTALHWAVMKNCDEEFIQLLLDNKVNVNLKNFLNHTALQYALTSEDKLSIKLEIVKTLIEAGADINSKGLNGKTALHWSVEKNNVKMVEFFLLRGANIHVKNDENLTAFQCALDQNNNLILVKKFIEAGANINSKDKLGFTVLHWASLKNDTAQVEYLLSRGADVNVANVLRQTPLHLAIIHNKEKTHLKLFETLLKNGANVNTQDKDGNAALHYLMLGHHDLQFVQLLLRSKINLNIKNKTGFTALQLAIKEKKLDVAKILIAAWRCQN